jgi:spore germination cell wall hydrolase CwlJ-like protein
MGTGVLTGGSLRATVCAAALVLTSHAVAHAQEPSAGLELPTFDPAAASLAAPGLIAPAPFVLRTNSETRARALHCLTQAVYYEAASEPREGQEAVAQVVLNRLKHPAFPKSVCGVVYEGAERETGCQFTFTCDGSLARAPSLERWDAAEAVAAAALDGHVAGAVGASTHYHAAWMTPYWSASLVRTQRIGGHVFYRLPGEAGSPEALTGQYAGAEPPAPTGLAAAVKLARAGGKHARHPAPLPPGVAEFSVWGLQVATITAHRGEVVIRSGS